MCIRWSILDDILLFLGLLQIVRGFPFRVYVPIRIGLLSLYLRGKRLIIIWRTTLSWMHISCTKHPWHRMVWRRILRLTPDHCVLTFGEWKRRWPFSFVEESIKRLFGQTLLHGLWIRVLSAVSKTRIWPLAKVISLGELILNIIFIDMSHVVIQLIVHVFDPSYIFHSLGLWSGRSVCVSHTVMRLIHFAWGSLLFLLLSLAHFMVGQ